MGVWLPLGSGGHWCWQKNQAFELPKTTPENIGRETAAWFERNGNRERFFARLDTQAYEAELHLSQHIKGPWNMIERM
jgi:hypothetical protein